MCLVLVYTARANACLPELPELSAAAAAAACCGLLHAAVTLLENTAENGYKPLTYQARCTPTGSWPDTTQVNLTATQYNTCGQTNLVTATNTTTLARTDPPTLTVTGPNTASVCSSAAGLQLSYTVTSTSSPADSFTATTTGSSAACLAGERQYAAPFPSSGCGIRSGIECGVAAELQCGVAAEEVLGEDRVPQAHGLLTGMLYMCAACLQPRAVPIQWP